jgi:hypothetical protein
MYSLRNALTSVVGKHGNPEEEFGNPRDDEYIVSIGVGSNSIISSDLNHIAQLAQQQPLYSNLSSEASEEVSAPSILFQSTEDSDTSSIQTPPSLSDLYHNPYDPLSFVKFSIQRNDTDTLAMMPAKSNYTASTVGESSNNFDIYSLNTPSAPAPVTNHSPTSVAQVPESMIAMPPAPSTPSTGTSTTTANTTSESLSSNELPSPPPKSRTLLPESHLPSLAEIESVHRMSPNQRLEEPESDRRDSPDPETRTTPSDSRCVSPFKPVNVVEKEEELKEMSPIKKDRESPWRIKNEPEEQQDLPEEKSPSRRNRGSPWRIKSKKNEKYSPPRHSAPLSSVSPARVVTPNKEETFPTFLITSPPKCTNSASSQALASMARLQELEQKKHALRHQRFSLEQRLYQFCASKEQAEAKLRQEQELAKMAETESMTEAEIPPKRLVTIIKRPWRSPRDRKPKKTTTKEEKKDAAEVEQTVVRATTLEEQEVVDWPYTMDIPATNEIVSGEHKLKKKKPLKVLYTGRLSAQGQPHGDDATIKYSDGQIYRGSVRNGLRSGNGHNVWPDGQEYKGEWQENSRNGRGTHSWKDGRTVTGDWKDGHLHGKIFFVWPNGATFDGSAKMGKKDGRGMY